MNKRSRLLTASLILSFFAVLGLAAMVQFTAQATGQDTFTVTMIADANDGACDDDCTLREAINAANVASGANIINFSLPPSATITLGGRTITGYNRHLDD